MAEKKDHSSNLLKTKGNLRYSGEYRYCLGIAAVCFMPRFIMALNAHPVTYISDEVSAISAAAITAGWPWHDVVANAGYYGFGFLFLLAPLFRLGLSARAIYRLSLVVLAAVDAAGALVCYRLQRRFFPELSRKFCAAVVIPCFGSIFFSLPDVNVRNENILILLTWGIAYLSCMLVKGQNKRTASILIVVILIYAQTVHSRALILSIGFIASCIIYYLVYRKKIIGSWAYAGIGAGTFAAKRLISFYLSTIWGRQQVRNSSVSNVLSGSVQKIQLSLTYISCILRIAFGQLYTAMAVSFGLFLLAVIVIIVFCIRRRNPANDNEKDRILFFLGMFFLINIAFTICGQSVSWANGVYNGVVSGEHAYHYKAFTYLRYFGYNVPPMIMTGLVIACKNRKILNISSRLYLIIALFLSAIWVAWIMPLIVVENNYYFKMIPRWGRKGTPIYLEWLFSAVFILIVVGGWVYLVRKNRWKIMILCAGCFMVFSSFYQFSTSTVKTQEYNENGADASLELLQLLDKVEGFPELQDIYVYDARGKTDHQIFYMTQFLNYKKHIIPGLPENPHEVPAAVISNRNMQTYFQYDYFWSLLDKNEYFFTSDKDLVNVMTSLGYKLNRVKSKEMERISMFYNPETGDHFYTLDDEEKTQLDLTGSYKYLGEGWLVEKGLTPYNKPVYRFYDKVNHNHFYITSEELRAEYMKNTAQYRGEGIAWYSADEGNPVYCLFDFKRNDNIYLTDERELNDYLEQGNYELLESDIYWIDEFE